ncbi:hypothetical protein K435DRAFT_86609 [Dendrothele bispora CBS 962.96]|uniref:Uncharacterized protein n=1 Tax=Dendrothele bispora (strain CBS 962.96) TaxID=1314807 RepID=A0A4S8M3P4_DENBC|nr:hypothetical protein K435DRAFT_86609 [Dendrothele bispora CBS 962.96]
MSRTTFHLFLNSESKAFSPPLLSLVFLHILKRSEERLLTVLMRTQVSATMSNHS